MVTTTVAMVPMKNSICAVRGRETECMGAVLSGKPVSDGEHGLLGQLFNFEYGTHHLLHCDFTWPPCLVSTWNMRKLAKHPWF